MAYINYYKVLGVEPTATEAQIKKAWLVKMHQHHPDVLPQKRKKVGEELSKYWNEAHDVLKSPEKRKKFDRDREDRILMYSSETLGLPVNDIPLLNALIKARSNRKFGGGYVEEGYVTRRSPLDKRNTVGVGRVSEDVYKVQRPNANGEIVISRRLDDYRLPSNRQHIINLNTGKFEYPWNEYFNINEIQKYGDHSNQEYFNDFSLPIDMADYLHSLDLIASQIASNGVATDMSFKEQFFERRLQAVRGMVSQVEALHRTNRLLGEPIQTIRLGDFENILKRDEGLVKLEWQGGIGEGQSFSGRRV